MKKNRIFSCFGNFQNFHDFLSLKDFGGPHVPNEVNPMPKWAKADQTRLDLAYQSNESSEGIHVLTLHALCDFATMLQVSK